MALTTAIKRVLNRALAPANLKVDTLTGERAELRRLLDLDRNGHFERPVYPVPASFGPPPAPLVEAIRASADRFDTFVSGDRNPVAYSFENSYFSSPDAEVLYAMLRWRKPSRYVEIGSGHSTRIARQAITDGSLDTRIICIDPSPRREIEGIADETHRARVEDLDEGILKGLEAGDFLFIDSSHELRPGNDVLHLLLRVIPSLPSGVVVHIHDVFLPYEYPREWIVEQRYPWTEQYLVAALLGNEQRVEATWPGYWLQRTWGDFGALLPHAGGRRAQSLWLSLKGGSPSSGPEVIVGTSDR